MPGWLTKAGLLAAAALTLSCVAERTDDPLLPKTLAAACPALASTCPAGCEPAGAHPRDVQNQCSLPFQAWGCEPEGFVGPPAIACTVTPDGTVWISNDNSHHPLGRRCNDEEWKAGPFPACR
jgi:hypothetical protein